MAYGQDFDMKEYIRKRMLEITNLKDRELFKETTGNILSAIYDYNQQAYKRLEQNILAECNPEQNSYAIYISITDQQHYDETDHFLYPMRPEDTKKTVITCEDINSALSEEQDLKLYTVYMKGTATQVRRLFHQEGRIFNGIIKTTKREYRASFLLKQNTDYVQMIQELYAVFGVNFQPWFTVNTAYLSKLADVYLCTSEKIKDGEQIEKIQIDFEEYTNQVKYDMIPLWNLWPLTEKTSTYPNPCVDKMNYEHLFFAQRLKPDCEYLVRDTETEITNIRRIHGDLYITCPIEKPCEWHLYEVHQATGKEIYQYPMLSNQYKESFSGSITEMFRRSIKTKAEMGRLIEAFDYEKYVTFSGFRLCSEIPTVCKDANYNMDAFLTDELRTGDGGRILVVQFTVKDPSEYLNEDIMSFLVTQVQRIFPDYHCVGEII
ncbi:hypothetical protein IMSAGC011_02316 [Lachnospiraceae bacterium]|nr:hypothetical protein IMSAGC011_02316 [Lachnospiraceae bacterium]